MDNRSVDVEVDQPFAGGDGSSTIHFEIPLTPGFRTGATIDQDTARELIGELANTLMQLGGGKPFTLGNEYVIVEVTAP